MQTNISKFKISEYMNTTVSRLVEISICRDVCERSWVQSSAGPDQDLTVGSYCSLSKHLSFTNEKKSWGPSEETYC